MGLSSGQVPAIAYKACFARISLVTFEPGRALPSFGYLGSQKLSKPASDQIRTRSLD
jgi:hypothetical protein